MVFLPRGAAGADRPVGRPHVRVQARLRRAGGGHGDKLPGVRGEGRRELVDKAVTETPRGVPRQADGEGGREKAQSGAGRSPAAAGVAASSQMVTELIVWNR